MNKQEFRDMLRDANGSGWNSVDAARSAIARAKATP